MIYSLGMIEGMGKSQTILVDSQEAVSRRSLEFQYADDEWIKRTQYDKEQARQDIGDYNRIGENARFFDLQLCRPDYCEK